MTIAEKNLRIRRGETKKKSRIQVASRRRHPVGTRNTCDHYQNVSLWYFCPRLEYKVTIEGSKYITVETSF